MSASKTCGSVPVIEFDGEDGDSVLRYLEENSVNGELQCSSVFNDHHVHALEKILKKNHSANNLTALKLPNNGLTEESSLPLANILRLQNETLRSIDLAQNPLKISGLTPIIDPLIHDHPPSQLRSLNLTKTSIGGQGAMVIASLLNHNTSLKDLNLSGNNFGTKGIKIIAPAIQSNTCLKSLNLSDNKINSRCCNILVKAIANSPASKLKSLNISSNNIGDAGIQIFAKHLRMDKQIEEFFAACTNIGQEGALHLSPVLEFNYRLKHLALGGNDIGPEGCKFLMEGLEQNQSTALKTLDLSWNSIGSSGAVDLGRVLMKNSKLSSINLTGNNIGSEGCAKLTEALSFNLSLRELILSNNQIDTSGAFLLAMALGKSTCCLETLSWAENPISDEGLMALERVPQFRKNQKHWFGKMLRDLADEVLFSINLVPKKIGDLEIMMLTNVLAEKHPLIRTFWLNGHTLSARSLVSLLQRALSPPSNIQRFYLNQCNSGDEIAFALGQALRYNKSLQVCSLSDSNISPKGAADIAEGLKHNKALRRLDLGRNNILDDGFVSLLEALPHPSLSSLSICSNGITDRIMSIEGLKHLDELSLNGNLISDRGAVRLCETLMDDCKLSRLCLRNNKMTERGSKAIQNFLPENAVCEFDD
jgi:Ran GTPase-activating protein (RanGAP) involved in mRNA processing and transport